MIDASIRLRRAIYLNDTVLVRRILRANPDLVCNPDFGDKSNTSLHLAAGLGYYEITEILLDANHETQGLSRNTDWETLLILAAAGGHNDTVRLLASWLPQAIDIGDKKGSNPLMVAAKAGHDLTVQILVDNGANVNAQDIEGDTPLHYASAYGCLKVIRTLLSAGASPQLRNSHSWTAISYSATVAAEVYFKNLVADFEGMGANGRTRQVGVNGQPWIPPERVVDPRLKSGMVAGVRLVMDDDGFPIIGRSQTSMEVRDPSHDAIDGQARLRANSGD